MNRTIHKLRPRHGKNKDSTIQNKTPKICGEIKYMGHIVKLKNENIDAAINTLVMIKKKYG